MNYKVTSKSNERDYIQSHALSLRYTLSLKTVVILFLMVIGVALSSCSSSSNSSTSATISSKSSSSSSGQTRSTQGGLIGIKHGSGSGSAQFYLTKNETVNFKVSCNGSGVVTVEITQATGKVNPPINSPATITSCNNKSVEVSNGPFYSVPTSKGKYFIIASVDTGVGVPWTFSAYSAS